MDVCRDNERSQPLAARQQGRVTRGQLRALGIGRGQIENWIARGILIPRLPRVYAIGHAAPSQESRLWEAVLYAGPGAMLSHITAAQWCGYITYAPTTLHVSTPRKIASLPGISVHARRQLPTRTLHAGVPVTTVAQTLLDLATMRPDLLPRALSQLDYTGALDSAEIAGSFHAGVRGLQELRATLTTYDPNFARLNEEFEVDFYVLCQEWGITPLPIPNVEIAPSVTIDALWPEHQLGVELDGNQNHRTDAQLLRDAERDLIARGLGLTIIRYRRAQFRRTPGAVREDLLNQLERHAPGRQLRSQPRG